MRPLRTVRRQRDTGYVAEGSAGGSLATVAVLAGVLALVTWPLATVAVTAAVLTGLLTVRGLDWWPATGAAAARVALEPWADAR